MFTFDKNYNYNYKMNIISGVLAAMALGLVNPFYSKFALRLGGTDFHLALIISLPYLVSIFAYLPGALFIETTSNKHRFVGIIMLLPKFFFLFIAFVPFMPSNHATIFVLILGFMNFFGSISLMGYQSIIGDVFLPQDRSSAMSFRNRYSALAGVIITFISGQLLIINKDNDTTIFLYQIFYVLSFAFSMAEVYYFFKLKISKPVFKEVKEKKLEVLMLTLKELPKNKKFMVFLFASAIFHFGWMGAQPIFNIYTLKVLNASEAWLSINLVATATGQILSFSYWGKLSDKIGNSKALIIAIIGMAITPFFYVLSKTMLTLSIFSMFSGVFIAGTILVLFNILLEVAPNDHRTVFMAVYNTILAIFTGLAPLILVKIKELTDIYVALYVIAILRFSSSFLFYKVHKIKKP